MPWSARPTRRKPRSNDHAGAQPRDVAGCAPGSATLRTDKPRNTPVPVYGTSPYRGEGMLGAWS